MLRAILFKNDMKQLTRDSFTLILLFAPLLLIAFFRLLEFFLLPFLSANFGLDTTPYHGYALSFVVLMNAAILGIVIGFMMLDDRDGNIATLMEVTPLGRSGYLINRLTMAAGLALVYGFAGCYVLQLVTLPVLTVLVLSLLSALYAAVVGLLIFSGADDKVKGLTFAKGLNVLLLFAFTDLFNLEWLTWLSYFFPPYWITAIIHSPGSLPTIVIAFFVHTSWLGLLIYRYWKRGA
jgi:fluoroquinolone transport system permease protein